jgi:adenosylhomocysteine nucleosidase
MSFDEPARSGSAPSIGFIAALASECASLRAHAANAGWLVVQSGPGAARASVGAAHALESGVAALVSWGLAGGLDAALVPGTVVVPRRILQTDGEPLLVDPALHAGIASLAEEFFLDYGDLLSVPAALESPAAKSAAAAATRAVAVDMESAAIATVAARARVPFVALRVVVDAAADALPQGAEQWIDERGRTRTRAALRAALSWRQWRPLLTLAKRYARANGVLERLARALAAKRLPAVAAPAHRAES